MTWEADWTKRKNDGNNYWVWARDLNHRWSRFWDWSWVRQGSLVRFGIVPPTQPSKWEIDWTRTRCKDGRPQVWARNLGSPIEKCRKWRWTGRHAIESAGEQWEYHRCPPSTGVYGKNFTTQGYVLLHPGTMSIEDVELCDRWDLWARKGQGRKRVLEHRLVAVKRYGEVAANADVVRHLNGIKDDNRPENLLYGSNAENNADHQTARRMAMYWRMMYERAIQGLTTELTLPYDDPHGQPQANQGASTGTGLYSGGSGRRDDASGIQVGEGNRVSS